MLSCVLFNAQSLKNKLNDLHYFLNINSYSIACVSETWLNNSVNDSILTDGTDYSVFRHDRCNSVTRGGGVCIFYHNTLTISEVSIPDSFSHVEICAADLKLTSHDQPLRIFTCYRPPSSSKRHPNDLAYIQDLCNCIELLLPKTGTILICGDLNFPSIDWSFNCSINCCSYTCTGIFLNFVYKHGLVQLVKEPTRFNNVLDIILTNDATSVINTCVVQPFSTSDHQSVNFAISGSVRPIQSQSGVFNAPRRNFNKADWDNIRCFLSSYNFYDLFHSNLPVQTIFDEFYHVLNLCIQLYVPVRLTGPRFSLKTRYPRFIRKLQVKKRNAWRQYRNSRSSVALSNYKRRATDCKSAINNLVYERENKLIDNGNLGTFYRYANRKLTSRSSIGPLIDETTNTTVTDPTHRAELLNSTFKNYFTLDNNIIPPLAPFSTSSQNLSNIYFNPFSVERAIKNLKIKSAGGPDGIPPVFLKMCSTELCPALSRLFELSFELNYVPPQWLTANITPLFKKGKRTNPKNYRPIALTSSLCKLMESIIKDQLLQYFLHNNFISKNQHAFISQRSTATNLLDSTTDWVLTLNSSQSTDIAYVDFSRAFDSIVFSKLLYKLQMYGISGSLLKWISSFLYGRTQRVVLENNFSSISNVLSGVPQGSVLGPVLFIIFINDIETVCAGSVKLTLYADDAKLYLNVNIHDFSLQLALDRLFKWATDWQLCINILKCFILSIVKPNLNTASVTQYFMNGVSMDNVDQAKDLGILITTDLNFNSHISGIVSQALQRSSLIFRGFTSRDPALLRKAFITYIRPLVEYNSVIWNPCKVFLVDHIESVQRSFTKRMPSLSNLSYIDRLRKLDLEPLELRRLKFDLTNYYKIIVLSHSPCLKDHFIFHNPPPSARSKLPRLVKPLHCSSQLSSSFFYRHTEAWNSLPESLRLSKSLPAFKNGLHKVDLSKFLLSSALK